MTVSSRTGNWFDNEHPSLRRCWHPVARSVDVVDGSPTAVELLGEHWCLVRLGGELTAFADACPHRRAPLSAGTVVGDTLRCAYHGFRFGSDGTCVEIPAVSPDLPVPARAAATTAAGVTEAAGLVWLAPEDPLTPLPVVPEHDDPDFTNCPLEPTDWNAAAAQMADNFLDLGHLPFLHLGTFGAEADRLVADYTLDRDGWTFRASHRHMTKALADSLDPGEGFTLVERELLFVFTAPHHVYLRIRYPEEDVILTISFCHQPLNASTTRLYCTDYRNDIADGDEAARRDAVAFQEAVAAEDKALLEQIRVKAVPLDAAAEYHSRADRITLEMRRTLSDLATAAGDAP